MTAHYKFPPFIAYRIYHIQDQQRAESKLESLLRQQKLLADIAQDLNRPLNLEKSLDEVLILLGEHTGVSRVYIFEDDPGGEATSNTV